MKKLWIYLGSFIFLSGLQAQDIPMIIYDQLTALQSKADSQKDHRTQQAGILSVAPAEWPEFPGGQKALIRYIQDHVVYPELARDHAHEGTVYVEYVVGNDGRVGQARVVRGLGMGCDEAALAIFEHMPRWKPARQGGRAVAVRYVTGVRFRLF